MEFSLEKCAFLRINQRKLMNMVEIKIQDNEIKSHELKAAYKYQGILQPENIKHADVKSERIYTFYILLIVL